MYFGDQKWENMNTNIWTDICKTNMNIYHLNHMNMYIKACNPFAKLKKIYKSSQNMHICAIASKIWYFVSK